MRVRRDSCFVSCVLFTLALLCLVPSLNKWVLIGRDSVPREEPDAWLRAYRGAMSDFATASLVIVLIALIVLWTGYIKHSRAAWLVMFVVVWAWAFPLLVLPLVTHKIPFTLSELLYNAIYEPGVPRIWAKSVLTFFVMFVALFLPIRPFFLVKEAKEPSRRSVVFSVAGVLLVVVALLVSIHLRFYEIPLGEINSTRQLPLPPPPPK